MTKRVLITGGAGYIGSQLVGVLLPKNYEVVVFDNLMFGGESLLGYWHHPKFRFAKGDITDADRVEEVIREGFDAIVHLAAIVGDPACAKQPEAAKKTNYEASVNLLNLAVKYGVERFVFASTCSNYGKMADSNGYVEESSPLRPVSLYAELKVSVENHILSMSRSESFFPTCLRFATVYGLSPRMRFDLTVNEFSKELALDRELKVFGEQFWRPYCHVRDVARAIEIVLSSDTDKIAYNVFNVGDTNENYKKSMIIDEIKKLLPKAKITYVHKTRSQGLSSVVREDNESVGFRITKNVPDGISEIVDILKTGVIADFDAKKYVNA